MRCLLAVPVWSVLALGGCGGAGKGGGGEPGAGNEQLRLLPGSRRTSRCGPPRGRRKASGRRNAGGPRSRAPAAERRSGRPQVHGLGLREEEEEEELLDEDEPREEEEGGQQEALGPRRQAAEGNTGRKGSSPQVPPRRSCRSQGREVAAGAAGTPRASGRGARAGRAPRARCRRSRPSRARRRSRSPCPAAPRCPGGWTGPVARSSTDSKPCLGTSSVLACARRLRGLRSRLRPARDRLLPGRRGARSGAGAGARCGLPGRAGGRAAVAAGSRVPLAGAAGRGAAGARPLRAGARQVGEHSGVLGGLLPCLPPAMGGAPLWGAPTVALAWSAHRHIIA